jgi:hypothetical protein
MEWGSRFSDSQPFQSTVAALAGHPASIEPSSFLHRLHRCGSVEGQQISYIVWLYSQCLQVGVG